MTLPSRRPSASITLLIAALALAASALIACGPPPIGWQGAGRMDTLPAPNPGTDAGGGEAGVGADLVEDPIEDGGVGGPAVSDDGGLLDGGKNAQLGSDGGTAVTDGGNRG